MICAPLYDCKSINESLVWSDTQQLAFDTIKKQLCEYQFLLCQTNQAISTRDRRCDYGIGAVLSQITTSKIIQ